MTNNSRLPAEWERQETVLLSWPHPNTDWNYMLAEAEDCFIRVAVAISKFARLLIVCPEPQRVEKSLIGKVDKDCYQVIAMPTNDTWARDFGPISLQDEDGTLRLLDFQFNGWGMKFAACYDNLVNSSLHQQGVWGHEMENRRDFVLEGGSIDSDGSGTILTTEQCLMAPNRNDCCDREQIDAYLRQTLHAQRILWLRHGFLEGDDTDSHVDTLARFLPGGKIAYSACDRKDDLHYSELKSMEAELREATTLDGEPYQLIPLPIPEAIYDADGNRLPATYANFLILNGAILLPIYNDPKYDDIAIKALSRACPDYEIVPIECTPLIQQHGSLHCITMQLPITVPCKPSDTDVHRMF